MQIPCLRKLPGIQAKETAVTEDWGLKKAKSGTKERRKNESWHFEEERKQKKSRIIIGLLKRDDTV